LQLNRHREAEVAPHAHDYAQLILYLAGEGWQTVSGRRRAAHPGDLFVIPAGVPHGFAVQRRSRPLCLVLDYEVADAARPRATHRRLPQATLNELHALLAQVPTKGRLTLANYSAILAVVARLLEQTPVLQEPPMAPTLYEKVRGLLRSPGAAPLARIAQTAGYHPDHLSRKLKRESGVSLRALRDQLRLENAQRALYATPTVAEAAAQAGFDDPNYFARWFRRQTGAAPAQWRRMAGRSEGQKAG
jgi:AraC-like DNA-binding protein